MHDDDLMPIEDGFPRPDWDRIGAMIDAQPEARWTELWTDRALRWVEATGASLSPDYAVSRSENFLLLSAQGERHASLLLGFLERARVRILSSLEGIASDEGNGPHVVLVFDEQDDYYRYLSHYTPDEGEFPLSGGVFLNAAYGHFAFPFLEMSAAESTSAHELVHACLRELPLPLWLEEGLAVTMEHEICGLPVGLDAERRRNHEAFWNEETIQELWSGESFGRADEGFGLSYELARLCVGALGGDREAFVRFANEAHYADGGEEAALDAFGASLGELVERFFGLEDCGPRPDGWSSG